MKTLLVLLLSGTVAITIVSAIGYAVWMFLTMDVEVTE